MRTFVMECRRILSRSAKLAMPDMASENLRAVALAILPFLVFASASFWLSDKAAEETLQAARTRFDFRVSETEFAVRQRMLAYEQVLRGGVGLFRASDDIRRDAWKTYVDTLKIDQNYPGIRGIGFSMVVRPDQLAEHIAETRASDLPNYKIWPEGERPEYTSIIYLEPSDWRNQRALGYDMFAEPVRHEAMARARDTGAPAMSGKVTLVQETNVGVQNGFLMYLPVFEKHKPLETVADRRRALLGYVYAPFRANDLMAGILGPQALQNIRMEIFDGAPDSIDTLMYDSLSKPVATGATSPAFTADKGFEFDGRKWTLVFTSLAAFDATIDAQKPRMILYGGLLVSLLFSAIVWSLALAGQRARKLAQANKGLETEIAERAKLEVELKGAKDRAEAASEAKSAFLANVSHELRTPLTLILAPLQQLLATESPSNDWRTQITRVHRNALLLLSRVNDILDFSKAEAGKVDVVAASIDPHDLVSAIADDASVVAAEKACRLSYFVDPRLSPLCLDPRHLEKIVLNFLSNAIKFTSPGGSIQIDVKELDEGRFELSVTDSGIGIAQDKLPLLFRRFEQLDTSTTRQYGGTGIGLALVKELAELMGGTVGVESEPGRGSRFFVHLPKSADRTSTQAAPPAAKGRDAAMDPIVRQARLRGDGQAKVVQATGDVGAHNRTPSAPTVLVIDDNPDMVTYVAELLQEQYNVLSAADGLEAWALLQQHCIDVVVSDVMMPGLDGQALAARIKASSHLAHVPVILVTARGGTEASATGLESGADDYVAKPFSPDELKARVRAALRMGKIQTTLRDKAHEAGMATLAMGILHNLGNVLSGVMVSSGLIRGRLRQSEISTLRGVVDLLLQHKDDLATFLTEDDSGRHFPSALDQLSDHLIAERDKLVEEVEVLRSCVEHARGVIQSQQSLVKPGFQLREQLSACGLIESAIAVASSGFSLGDVNIERDHRYRGAVFADRHKILQILVNLLGNAARALQDSSRAEKHICTRVAFDRGCVLFEIGDNGVGIDHADLPKLFNQVFTTSSDGNGLGLHSSANWAREMGGTLTCDSAGLGCGATFTLTLPATTLTDQSDEPSSAMTIVAE